MRQGKSELKREGAIGSQVSQEDTLKDCGVLPRMTWEAMKERRSNNRNPSFPFSKRKQLMFLAFSIEILIDSNAVSSGVAKV